MRQTECCKDVIVVHKKRRSIKIDQDDIRDLFDEASRFIAALDIMRVTSIEQSDQLSMS